MLLKKEKKIPFKNYLILAIILIITAIILTNFYLLSEKYQNNSIDTSIMNEYLKEVNYNEIEDYLIENEDIVIYITSFYNDRVKNFEEKFSNIITNHHLNNNILYLNILNELNDKKTRNTIVKEYGSTYPIILVYNSGNITSKYNIKKDNYNINKLEDFLIKEEIIDD